MRVLYFILKIGFFALHPKYSSSVNKAEQQLTLKHLFMQTGEADVDEGSEPTHRFNVNHTARGIK